MADLTLIWNPIAGNGSAMAAHTLVVKKLSDQSIPFFDKMTTAPGHATELAKTAAAAGCERVISMGGDGTLREVAIGLMGTKTALCPVPCGTGNDMARSLRIPSKDPLAALDIALSGVVRPMDAGLANGIPFFNVGGLGFDVDVIEEAAIFRNKHNSGSLSYLFGLLEAIRHLQNRQMHIVWDDGELDVRGLIVAAANGSHYGGGMHVAPGASPFDGKLEVCVLHNITKKNILLALPKFVKGTHKGSRYATFFQTTSLSVTAEPVSHIQLDGEIMPGTPVTFRILPGAVLVSVPE